ncbi:MAG: hypothetical protein M1826_000681 [Phylliscum demangeonii]|nr:MAG: hypothetical protein M1826_000681 [Phylliscum demangeonii]
MAAPAAITLHDLTGAWVMNRKLSDDTEPILAIQGISWFMRKAIGLATITLHINHYADPTPPHAVHIDIVQTATGGLKGTTELRVLDWQTRTHDDYIFGPGESRSRWVDVDDADEVPDEFLRVGWLKDRRGPEGRLIQSWIKSSQRDWLAVQIWGFEEINGQPYHVRHVVVTTATERKAVRLVYDWIG